MRHAQASLAGRRPRHRQAGLFGICVPARAHHWAAVGGLTPFPWEDGPLLPLREARANFEARYLAEALRQESSNVSRTARRLGLSRFMVQKKMKEFGLRSS